jgi:hypothetical protein
MSDDQLAIERYRYMLRTAPPDDIERAHAEAFARLTPEQRRVVLTELSKAVPPSERPASDDPQALARAATRAEIRDPGMIERTFGRVQTPGLGGIFLSTLAGAFVGTAVADAFFGGPEGDAAGGLDRADTGEASDAEVADAGPEAGADQAGFGAEGGWGDAGDVGGDIGLGDVGGFGDFGGDFGGGDFGGGDFG